MTCVPDSPIVSFKTLGTQVLSIPDSPAFHLSHIGEFDTLLGVSTFLIMTKKD